MAGNAAGVIVGVIVLDETRWPWTHPSNPKGYYLYNQQWWVEPGSRRGAAGLKLLDWAIAQAEARGMRLMLEKASLDTAVAEKDQFVRRKGFKYLGGKFFRESAAKA